MKHSAQDYNFTCKRCRFKWTKMVIDPAGVKCPICARRGITSLVTARKRRSDAKKAAADPSSLNIHSRPVRTLQPTAKVAPPGFKTPMVRTGPIASASAGGGSGGGGSGGAATASAAAAMMDSFLSAAAAAEEDDDSYAVDDPAFVPAPAFNREMRFSAGGTFKWTRALPAHDVKSVVWTTITAAAGRASTAAQFGGESAGEHGTANAKEYNTAPTTGASRFEWCHLIADSLGGATVHTNLFCGSYHANTAMLCIESELQGMTQLQVSIEVLLRKDTQVGEKITYSIRSAKTLTHTSFVLDGLATGCTKADGATLSGEVKAWIQAHGK